MYYYLLLVIFEYKITYVCFYHSIASCIYFVQNRTRHTIISKIEVLFYFELISLQPNNYHQCKTNSVFSDVSSIVLTIEPLFYRGAMIFRLVILLATAYYCFCCTYFQRNNLFARIALIIIVDYVRYFDTFNMHLVFAHSRSVHYRIFRYIVSSLLSC